MDDIIALLAGVIDQVLSKNSNGFLDILQWARMLKSAPSLYLRLSGLDR